ncbi:inositol 2-dehydrogenase-like isoform X2 [Carettochelys insculpta]|uniref:inositol 2-dehydrogenase-like isoform X2 n=1 Tax=Carettochelys insculpta TaxID=44489 RepID=UPI003EBEC1A6
MGRKKKTLHDYAAEFTDLGVKRHLIEHGAAGESSVVETLYCKSCELPMRVRRDRILEHLSSGRHYRNRRLVKQHGLRTPILISADSELGTSLSMQLDTPSLLSQPSFILSTNPCITSTGTSYSMVPSPLSYHKSLIPVHPSAISSTTTIVSAREDQTPSTSTSHPSAFAALHMRNAPFPSKQNTQRLVISEASNSVASGGSVGRYSSNGTSGSNIGLALFGVGLGNKALFQSLMEENGCCLLYIVEDQLPDVERAFSTEFLANIRVLRQQDADIVLNDQRVSGAIICSPPEAASEIVIDALRAGKGVFCEKLPSLDRQTAEACFDEADRCGRPLVCGFYKRFDPALQFLYKKVRDSQALGTIHRISTVSSIYPAASLSFLKKSGGIFYNAAVHDIDIISLLLGESAPDTIFSLGHAFCADMAYLKDADTVAVSMKFPSGAIVTLDISQHCTTSCDQRLEVHGSQGTLRVDNQNPLGITEHGTSVSIYSQTQADRYKEAYRELFRHFLRTLKDHQKKFYGGSLVYGLY